MEVAGPDGRPLGGITVKGKSQLFQTTPYSEVAARFEVRALEPARPRRVVVLHEGKGLIGSALLRGDEPGPVIIALVPWGTVAGRIVDEVGEPRMGVFLGNTSGNRPKNPETDDIIPGGDWNQDIPVGNDGRFRVERLVPGLRYSGTARAGLESPGDLFVDVSVAPGETRDMGDLKARPPGKPAD